MSADRIIIIIIIKNRVMSLYIFTPALLADVEQEDINENGCTDRRLFVRIRPTIGIL